MDYALLQEYAMQPRAQEETVSYLAEKLSHFVKWMDPVLICLPDQEPGGLSHLMEQAVLLCEGVPVTWGRDHRWMSLLRLAFSSRASANCEHTADCPGAFKAAKLLFHSAFYPGCSHCRIPLRGVDDRGTLPGL